MSMTLACVWSVTINGTKVPLERKRHITSIEVEESCDGSNTATITVLDKDMEYINDNIYIEDASISVNMHFIGADGSIQFDGFISAIDIDFPEQGIPTMTLYCLDKSHVMNRTKKKRSWKNTTNMSVAQKIAQEYGFKFEGEPSYAGKVKDTVSQSNQTDIEFLESLANGEKPDLYMCKLVGDTLIYKKKGLLTAPVVELHYKEYPWEVRSFRPQINKETMEDTSSSADVSTNTKITDSASSSGTGNAQGDAVSGSSVKVTGSSGWSGSSKGGYSFNTSTLEVGGAQKSTATFHNPDGTAKKTLYYKNDQLVYVDSNPQGKKGAAR